MQRVEEFYEWNNSLERQLVFTGANETDSFFEKKNTDEYTN